MRSPFRFRDLRLAAVVVLIVSLLAGLSGTARADDDKRLVIRSVDALKYPDTHVTVLPVGPAPSPSSYEVQQNGAPVSGSKPCRSPRSASRSGSSTSSTPATPWAKKRPWTR